MKLRAKADRLFSTHIRTLHNWTCQNCGHNYANNKGGLHTAHLISRRYSWTRTHTPNATALCHACHTHYTGHPYDFAQFIATLLTPTQYAQIRKRSYRRDKFNWTNEIERLQRDAASASANQT